MWTVYILQCEDDTLYCGITTDLDRRTKEHNQKTGAKYTRSRTPVEVVYVEKVADQGAALRREYAIKQMSRAEKEALIAG